MPEMSPPHRVAGCDVRHDHVGLVTAVFCLVYSVFAAGAMAEHESPSASRPDKMTQ
jgi:hypothetical protein